MNKFIRMAALLIGLMTVAHVNAAKVEKPNNWKWVSMTREKANQTAYLYNVGHDVFMTTDNKPSCTDITKAQIWDIIYHTTKVFNQVIDEYTTISCTTNNLPYRVRIDDVYQADKDATKFYLDNGSALGSYKLRNNLRKYLTVANENDEYKYSSGNTNDAGNDWIMIDPNNTDQINSYKNNYAAYATAYAAAKALKDFALPTTQKNKLTEVLAKETTYENVVANTEELNSVVAEIKALTFGVNITANYATVYLPFNAAIPAGVTAYRLDSYNADNATMDLKKVGEEGDVLPAGKGFVLHTDNNADYSFSFSENTPVETETNLLAGTTTEETQDQDYYYWVISKSSTTGKVGFYILNDGISIPANKAYFAIKRNQVDPAACSMFSFGDNPTGIHSASSSQAASIVAIYNANGKKQAELTKGINIVKMSDGTIKKIKK